MNKAKDLLGMCQEEQMPHMSNNPAPPASPPSAPAAPGKMKNPLKMFVDKVSKNIHSLEVKPEDIEEFTVANWDNSGMDGIVKRYVLELIKAKVGNQK